MTVCKEVKIRVTLPGGCTVTRTGSLTVGIPEATTLNECEIRIVDGPALR